MSYLVKIILESNKTKEEKIEELEQLKEVLAKYDDSYKSIRVKKIK